MNAFLRQMAVLAVLTTLAEYLLPDGGIRRAGRMVMGLVMMLIMLTTMLSIFKMPLPKISGAAIFQYQAELAALPRGGSYRDTVLDSLQRQAELAARQAASAAGYEGLSARVRVSDAGEITAVSLYAEDAAMPAFAGESAVLPKNQDLIEKVAQEMNLSQNLIHVELKEEAR